MSLPKWKSVPAGVLEALCSNLREEGISTSTTINVVKTTQRLLVTPSSLQALAEMESYRGKSAAVTVTGEVAEISIDIPPGCGWRPVEPQSRAHYIDTLTLELSPPILNPFVKNSAGLFARLALAEEAPTWYWVPLVPQGGELWGPGTATLLPYRQ